MRNGKFNIISHAQSRLVASGLRCLPFFMASQGKEKTVLVCMGEQKKGLKRGSLIKETFSNNYCSASLKNLY